MKKEKKYIFVKEAAELSNVTKETIRNWVKDFSIGVKFGGRYKVDLEGLEKIINGEIFYGKEIKERNKERKNKK